MQWTRSSWSDSCGVTRVQVLHAVATRLRCSLEEVTRILLYLPQPTYTIAALAAFTGLRRSELAGQLWENYDGNELQVTRSVWERSKAPVPSIPALARILNAYRDQCGSPKSGPMFASAAGTPLNLNNALNRMILPALNKCELCGKERMEHAGVDHKYKRDASRPEWHGWHAFRRGLATNLYRLGVNDKTIQAILRHSNVATTMDIYVKTVSADSTAAMTLLETALCADRAPSAPPVTQPVIN